MADEVDDIGADIMRAMQSDEPVAALPTEVLPADTADDAHIETASEKADRVRDEHGRFAKSDEVGQSAEAQQQEPAKTILPPTSWTVAAKAKFATLDPDVQAEILRSDKAALDGKVQWETKAEQYNRLDAALSKVRDRYRLAGLSDDQYVGALVQADEMLRGPNAHQALLTLAQQYGINLGALAQTGQQPFANQAYVDPNTQALQQELQGLKSRFEAQDKAKEAAEQQATLDQIEAFRQDPAHIYFDNVKTEMAALLQAGSAKTLDDAYEMATYANRDIRQLLAAAAASNGKTLQTKPAGVQVTGAQRGSTARPAAASHSSSIEDDVAAAYNEVVNAGRV